MTNEAIYNEIEPYAANWLEQLIVAGHIAAGRVERRSIVDLKPADVAGHGQRHFFAGIGGWSIALRLAGIPDDVDVWTGSCPCQPFSDAGKRSGTRDARHLWPTWFELIRECRPPAIFGEQVASRAGLAWFDAVRADLDGCGYAVGASDLCAAGIGAPHIRQRLYFVAYARDERREGERVRVQPGQSRSAGPKTGGAARLAKQLGNSSSLRSRRDSRGLPDAETQGEAEGRESRRVADEPLDASAACPCEGDYCTDPDCNWLGHSDRDSTEHDRDGGAASSSRIRTVAGSSIAMPPGRSEGRTESGDGSIAWLSGNDLANTDGARLRTRRSGEESDGRDASRIESAGLCTPDWRNVVWLPCLDGKARPVEPGLEPLAHGVSKGLVAVRSGEAEHLYNRAGALAGFGNAIVPELAAAFIKAAEAARKR